MRCFEIDLNNILKIKLLGKEELIPPRYHCTRYAPEYILYAVFDGELYLEESGKKLNFLPVIFICLKKATITNR